MGASVAAVIIRREREIVDAFRTAGATAPDRAGTLDALGLGQTVALRRLRQRAVLRETASGALWLDEPSWEALGSMRRRMIVVMLAVVALLALAGAFATRARAQAAPRRPSTSATDSPSRPPTRR